MKKSFFFIFLVFFTIANAQKNWHLSDIKKDGYVGISLEKAYKLLKNRKSQPIVVAVIDGGVDTAHIDLKNVLWKNPDEKLNGIDDDGNGYVDDIYGWNFIGNSKGENIDNEAYEVTRIYQNLRKKYENIDTTTLNKDELKEYELYKKVKKEVIFKFNNYKNQYLILNSEYERLRTNIDILKKYFKKESLNDDEVKELLKSDNDSLRSASVTYMLMKKRSIDIEEMKKELNNLKKEYLTYYNPDTNIRILVGDNPYDITDSIYGNNDVTGPSAGHGTFVAGIIAADRTNGNDAIGIADNVKIMSLRVVPGGDERDKDVALAIKYAVRKGAKIINMSFGKPYSPQKHFVDEAIKFADKHNVLMIHAAGNEGENNDSFPRYPMPFDKNGNKLTDLWINVGATDMYLNSNLIASFSNYGNKTVDIFAPGVNIYSTSTGNRYTFANGTSAAAPVVTGVAALLMSYFPELTPIEIKNILMKSAYKKKIEVILPQSKNNYMLSPEIIYEDFNKTCVSGGIVNAYNAVKLAIKEAKKKK